MSKVTKSPARAQVVPIPSKPLSSPHTSCCYLQRAMNPKSQQLSLKTQPFSANNSKPKQNVPKPQNAKPTNESKNSVPLPASSMANSFEGVSQELLEVALVLPPIAVMSPDRSAAAWPFP